LAVGIDQPIILDIPARFLKQGIRRHAFVREFDAAASVTGGE